MTYNNTGVIGPQDGDIQIKLNEDHRPTADYVQPLREQLPRRFPGIDLRVPAGRHRQPDPEFRRAGADRRADPRREPRPPNFAYANLLLKRIRHIPGVADARIQQSPSNPTLNVDVDRTRAQYVGLTERDVTNSLVVDLAGSGQVAPTFWLNPDNGVSYPIVMQTPQYQLDTLSASGDAADLGRGRRDVADSRRHRQHHANDRQRGRLPIQHPADGADLRDAAGTRSRRGRRRRRQAASPTPRQASPRAARWRCSARCRP